MFWVKVNPCFSSSVKGSLRDDGNLGLDLGQETAIFSKKTASPCRCRASGWVIKFWCPL